MILCFGNKLVKRNWPLQSGMGRIAFEVLCNGSPAVVGNGRMAACGVGAERASAGFSSYNAVFRMARCCLAGDQFFLAGVSIILGR